MLKKSALTAAVALTLGSGAAQATQFNMITFDFSGTLSDHTGIAGTANIIGGTANVGSGTFTSNGNLFSGHDWTATVSKGFTGTGAGSWKFSTATGASATGTYNFTLAAGQEAMGLLFDWNRDSGIPVLNIVNADGSGVDMDSDGTLGTTMLEGPFAGSPVGFAGAVVPVPAAVWLFGSGLIGLVGVARRRRSS